MFRSEMGEIGSVFGETLGGMSADALSLSAKLDRLQSAIRNQGPASTAAKTAAAAYRRELESFTQAQAAATRTTEQGARQRVAAAVAEQKELAELSASYREIAIATTSSSRERVAATELAIKAEKQLAGVTASSAADQVAAAARIRRSLEQQAAEYRALAQAAGRGSAEQIAALNLLARAESQLAASHAGAGRPGRGRAQEDELKATRFGRGALVATGGAGRALAFGSDAFILGIGTTLAVKTFLKAAADEEKGLALVRNALRNTGNSWSRYGKDVTESTEKLVRSSGFSKEEILPALSLLIRRTGDVHQALDLMGTASDLARGRGIELSLAVGIIIRALNGQVGSLKRAGIEAVKVTAAQDALKASGQKASAQAVAQAKALDAQATQEGIIAAVRARYGRAAADFLATEAGKQALVTARIKESEAVIGRALAPAYDRLLDRTAKYLDHLNKTGKLQREVDHLLKEGGDFAHILGDGFHFANSTITPAVHALGGVEKVLKVLIALRLARALKGWATGFTGVGRSATRSFSVTVAAATAATEKIEADSLAMDAALTRATRPREIIITETVAGGKGGILGFLGGGKGKAGLAGLGLLALTAGGGNADASNLGTAAFLAATGNPELAAAYLAFTERHRLQQGADWISKHVFGQSGKPKDSDLKKQAHEAVYKGTSDKEIVAFASVLNKFYPGAGDTFLKYVNEYQTQHGAGFHSHHAPPPKNKRGGSTTAVNPPGPPITDLTFDLKNQLLDAERTKDQGDDLRVLKRQEGYLLGLLKQKGLTHANILDIKSELNSVTSQIESIQSQQTSTARENANKRARAYQDHITAAERRLKAAVISARADNKKQYELLGKNAGLIQAGNIDLLHRPHVKNADGSISSVRSLSFEEDGKEVLIPTVIPDGKGGYKVVSDKQAIAYYKKTGQNLGKFSSIAAANRYAQRLHLEQAGLGETRSEAETKLINFYRKLSHDKRLSEKQRAHYAELAVKEVHLSAQRIAADNKALRQAEIKRLEGIPVDLGIAEERARIADNKPKLLNILRQEVKSIEHQVQELRRLHAGKAAILAALKKEASIEAEIRRITKEKDAAAGAEQSLFLSEAQRIIGAYAPNFFPAPGAPTSSGRTDTHLYEIAQELRKQTPIHLRNAQRGAYPATAHALTASEAAFAI